MSIYFLCKDSNHPSGGNRVLYRHVDILNKNSLSAYVLHQQEGFRCTWFDNQTQVAYLKESPFGDKAIAKVRRVFGLGGIEKLSISHGDKSVIDGNDILVLPECYGPDLAFIGRGINRVILNQNGYLTFEGYSFNQDRLITPYTDPSTKAVLVNSEQVEEYMEYAFPNIPRHRFFLSINTELFHYQANKKKKICFSKIKNIPDAMQVINLLKFRGNLKEYEFVSFIGRPQREVAEIFAESLIYLNFGNREGFGLPSAEAMASGCVVVGYDGGGGREFMTTDYGFPVLDGNIVEFAKAVEHVVAEYEKDPTAFSDLTQRASQFIRETYNPQKEERILVDIWKKIYAQLGTK